MATANQIAANRSNAQKSTGPRTDAGKQITRLNALKSGLHAESHIVRGEDPEALAQLTAEYYAEFHPVTPRQRDLVDTLVHNQWLIRRLRLTEADLYAHHFADRDHNFDPKYNFHKLRQQHALADGFETLEKRLARLQSRINSLERSSRSATKELRELPATPQATDEPDACDQIGFVPSNPPDIPNPEPRIPAAAQPHLSPAPGPRPPAPAVTPSARATINPKATALCIQPLAGLPS